jgi:hypothetical protein
METVEACGPADWVRKHDGFTPSEAALIADLGALIVAFAAFLTHGISRLLAVGGDHLDVVHVDSPHQG